MGARAGGGAGFFSSGVGSNRSYGMNKYQKTAFEAMKGDLSYNGQTGKNSKGRTTFNVMGKSLTEGGLAKMFKSEWAKHSDGSPGRDKTFAKTLTLNMTNNKTGQWFDTSIIK